jgi:hypothetical protein
MATRPPHCHGLLHTHVAANLPAHLIFVHLDVLFGYLMYEFITGNTAMTTLLHCCCAERGEL